MEPSRCRSPNFGGYVGALSVLSAATLMLAVIVGMPKRAKADEGGVSFWLPGQYGSLAATPLQPGLSVAEIFYHASLFANGSVATARAITIGQFNPTINLALNANLAANANLVIGNATYAFATPVLDGQLAVGMAAVYGRSEANLNATITASLGPLMASRTIDITDVVTGFGDLYPTAALRWNKGIDNYMLYVTGDLPVGLYNSSQLANIGIGHYAVDTGGGYTYFNAQTGREFSAVTGFTYNFINPSTKYQNGIDWHFDWGASQFITKQVQIGSVGYVYQQVSSDSGSGDRVGPFLSRVVGIGPQVGFLFPVGTMQGYLNLKGYADIDQQNRAHGWSTWITFSLSPSPQPPASAQPTLVRKY
jgi:hypothetical protein